MLKSVKTYQQQGFQTFIIPWRDKGSFKETNAGNRRILHIPLINPFFVVATMKKNVDYFQR